MCLITIYQTTAEKQKMKNSFVINVSPSLHRPPLTVHRPFMLTVVCSRLPKARSEAEKTLNFVLSFYTAKKKPLNSSN